MQKMRTIFPTICIAFLLCACSVGERGVRLDNSGKTEDSCVEAIFEILNESDRDALESLFSDNALSKIDNFDEQATILFEVFEGKECTWERTGLTVSDDAENGKSIKKAVAWYSVSSGNEEFTFLIIDCLEDDNSSNNIGLYTLWVVDSENEDSQLTAWQDMETPRIHIAIAK